MKIEDLLECSADELEKMTDAELLKHFEPYFNVVRPEFAPKPQKPTHKPTPVANTKQFSAKLDQLKELGLDLSYLKGSVVKKRK